jgi:hypothetical protein
LLVSGGEIFLTIALLLFWKKQKKHSRRKSIVIEGATYKKGVGKRLPVKKTRRMSRRPTPLFYYLREE